MLGFESIITLQRGECYGTTNSGIKMKGYINQDKTTAFPKYEGDK